MVNVVASVESVPGFAAQNSSSPFEAQRKIPDFSIVAVGDMGCSSSASELVHDINNKIPELILALGDLSYQRSDASCWFKIISPLYNKMKIVLGDHDYGSNSLIKQYKSHFNMSQEYYSFNYENVHLIALATEIPFDINSSQYNFVKNDLEAASINPDIKWILVYSYRPQYSSPSKHPGNGDLRDLYHPLFQKYNVDVVIQAHNHNYQRTYPINYNHQASSNPFVTDNNSKSFENSVGQVYVTIGTGGAGLHKFSGKALYMAAQYMGFGFLDISIQSNGRNLTGNFYASSDDLVKDSFTLIK